MTALDLVKLILDVESILLFLAFIIYFALDIKTMIKLSGLLLSASLLGRVIHGPLLEVEDIRYVWYMIWALVNLSVLTLLFKIIKENPHTQKITIPIGMFYLLGILLYVIRHFEKNVTFTNFSEMIYKVGDLAFNWMVLLYLFAPIALLLVKFLKSQMTAKH